MRALRGSALALMMLAAGTPFFRPLDVPAAGWVRVPLDLAALRHVGLASSLRITSPTGEDVPRWTAPFFADSERRPVKVLEVAKDERGWTLRLDVGPEPLVHERLLLDLAKLTTVPDVALDASQDGKSWEPLVAGDLFRLGEAAGLARTSLLYPATSARYLRLSWPAQAGFPELRSVVVEPTAPGRSLTITSRSSPCRGGSSASTLTCRLPLPAAGQVVRRLTVELAAGGNVGYGLYQPRAGAWQPLAEGVWRGARSARHVIPLAAEPLAGDNLRLELFGAPADPAPRLLGHSIDLAVDTVLFYAETPGRYTLSYGGVPSPGPGAAQPDARSVAAGVEAAWIVPGPEEEARMAALPAAAAPGATLSRERFRAAWSVSAAGAAAGDLVRLALPDPVYAQARTDLGDLRLAAGNRQLPYVLWSPPDPVPVVERTDLRPEAEKGRHYSRIEVYLPAAGLPITQLRLTAPPSPLRRPIGVRFPDPGPPGLAAREERLVARSDWECLPEPPLPCRLVLPLSGPAPRHLTVRFADGDNSPLPTVDVAAWRRGDVLLFAWPGQGSDQGGGKGKVQLLAGAPDLRAPIYDLAALAEVLPGRPSQPAELDLTGDDLKQGSPPWWSRWVIPAAVVAAAIFLLALLRRILADV
ncbi:MAG: DUF3999 family protein [Acidobacteria bacterium]|nr:DUF3999 family protein [Acidobacteriota bacterium]